MTMGKTAIIIRREFNERVRKKSFIITTILTPILLVGIMVVPALMMNLGSDKPKDVIVVDESGLVSPKLTDEGTLRFRPSDRTLEEIRSEKPEVFGILVVGADVLANPRNVVLYTYESSTVTLEEAIKGQIEQILQNEKLKAYNIEDLDRIMAEVNTPVTLQTRQISDSGEDRDSSSVLSMIGAYLFGFLIYFFVFIYGNMVMQGVIEEKSSKVLEVMVSSVRPYQLMMGKILGIAAVAVTQFVIWVLFIGVVGTVLLNLFAGDMVEAATAMQSGAAGALPVDASMLDPDSAAIINIITDPWYLLKMMGAFIVYFIGGYLLYAAMFAAVGSAVDNEKDTQNLQMPITLPLVLAFFVMISTMQDPHSSLAFWFSMIPLTSPIVMMARIPYGVPGWEIAVSVAVLYLSFAGIVWLAAKIYRVGIFMYGKKPTFAELYKWTRYKA